MLLRMLSANHSVGAFDLRDRILTHLMHGLGHLSLFCLKVVKVGYQNCCQFHGEHTKSAMDVPVKRTNESLDLSPCSSCGAEDRCKLIFIGFA